MANDFSKTVKISRSKLMLSTSEMLAESQKLVFVTKFDRKASDS